LIPRYIEARLIDIRASLYIDNHDRVQLIQFLVLGFAVANSKPPKFGDTYLAHGYQQNPMVSLSRKLPTQIGIKDTELR
jgi:hypothetical protein